MLELGYLRPYAGECKSLLSSGTMHINEIVIQCLHVASNRG